MLTSKVLPLGHDFDGVPSAPLSACWGVFSRAAIPSAGSAAQIRLGNYDAAAIRGYMFSMIAEAYSLVFSLVAPGIIRSRS